MLVPQLLIGSCFTLLSVQMGKWHSQMGNIWLGLKTCMYILNSLVETLPGSGNKFPVELGEGSSML